MGSTHDVHDPPGHHDHLFGLTALQLFPGPFVFQDGLLDLIFVHIHGKLQGKPGLAVALTLDTDLSLLYTG